MRVKLLQKTEIDRDPITTGATKSLPKFDDLSGLEVLVLGAPFGGDNEGKDGEGEFFDPTTDTVMNPGDTRALTFFHGFNPNGQGLQDPPQWIGVAKFLHADELGHWFVARLDNSQPLAQRITIQRLHDDEIKASSGAVSHLVRRRDDGLLTHWPIGEIAIFDTNSARQPANQLAVVSLKSEQPKGDPVKVAGRSNEADISSYLIPIIIKEII